MFMRKPALYSLAAAAALALVASPGVAHHSFGHYDMTKTTTIAGTVSKWEWGNPHSWLFVDVPQAGKVTTYGFELRSPGELMRSGWKKTSVQPGDKIKVDFRPMKDGTPAGLMVHVYDGSGKMIGHAPPGGEGPPPSGGTAS